MARKEDYTKGHEQKRQCPFCLRLASERTEKCVCGAGLTSGSAPRKYLNLLSGAGPCPLKLDDYPDLRSWVVAMLDYGHKKGVHYQPSAIRLYLRDCFDSDAQCVEYKTAIAELRTFYHEAERSST